MSEVTLHPNTVKETARGGLVEQKFESTSKQELSKLVQKSVLELGIKILVKKFHLEIAKIALGSFFNLKRFAHKIGI